MSLSSGDEPSYLAIGTDVSAKYKGAFCEAKIKKIVRNVKCKLTLKQGNGSITVDDELIRGSANIRVGANVEVKHPDKNNQLVEAVISKILDQSVYTVVFDDGDEATLKRTSLCLKSGKHFAESETLDQSPLTNPEHFGNPVSLGRRRRRRIQNNSDSEDDESYPADTRPNLEKDPDWGKVVCVDYGDKRGSKKDIWFPALIVAPTAQENVAKIGKEEHLVRSFRDGRFYQVLKKDTRDFIKELSKAESNSSALRSAMEKATVFVEKQELPHHWDYDLLMGNTVPQIEEENDTSEDFDSALDESDDEQSEEKDRFVAQLYKYMDERGTPINRAPSAGGRELNLYKLYRIVVKMGGYNRVTNKNLWRAVYSKLGLPPTASQPGKDHSSVYQLKSAFKKYLHAFDDFYRKLGCTMVSVNSRTSRPSRGERLREDRVERSSKKPIKKEKEPKKVIEETIIEKEKETIITIKKEKEIKEEPKPEEIRIKQEEVKPSRSDDSYEERKRGRGRKRREESAVDEPPVDEDTMTGQSTIDESEEEDPKNSKIDESSIKVGDGLKVKYGRGRQLKVYEAKVLKIELDKIKNKNKYFVHYSGWNSRYDEWIKRSRIVQVIRDRSPRRRSGKLKNKGEPLQDIAAPVSGTASTTSASNLQSSAANLSLPLSSSSPSMAITAMSNTNTGSSVSSSNANLSSSESVESLKSSAPQPPKRGRPPNSTKTTPNTNNNNNNNTPLLQRQPSPPPQQQSSQSSQPPQLSPQSSHGSSQTTAVRRGRPPLSTKKEKLTRSKSMNDDQSTNDSFTSSSIIDEVVKKSTDDKKRDDSSIDEDVSEKYITEISSSIEQISAKVVSEKETVVCETTAEISAKCAEESNESDRNVFIKIEETQATTESEAEETPRKLNEIKKESEVNITKSEETSPVKDAFDFDDDDELIKEEEPLKDQLKKKRKAKDESKKALNFGSNNGGNNSKEQEKSSTAITRKYSKKARKIITEPQESDETKDQQTEEDSITIAAIVHNESEDSKQVKSAANNDSQKDNNDGSKKRKGRKRKEDETNVAIPVKKKTKPIKLEIPEEDSNLEVQKFFEKTTPAVVNTASPVDEVKVLPQFTNDINPSQQSSDYVSTDFLLCEEAVPASPEKEIVPEEHMPMDEPMPTNESPHSGNSSPSVSPEEDNNKDHKFEGSGSNSEIENELMLSKDQLKAMESMPSPLHDEDSMPSRLDANKSPISPKKRRRGRVRTISQSDSVHQAKERVGCKTRGSSGRHRVERHSPLTALELRSPFSISSNISFENIVPQSKYNFCTPIEETIDPDRRINILQERLSELRKTYLNIKSEVAVLDRKKKKARRKEREKKEMNRNNGNGVHSSGSGSGSSSGNSVDMSVNHRHNSSSNDINAKESIDTFNTDNTVTANNNNSTVSSSDT